MSTRATIHFQYPKQKKPVAIVYRHGDGYPDGLGADLQAFFKEVRENVKDLRFDDPSYLAAKWIVWDAKQHAIHYDWSSKAGNEPKETPAHFLDFLSVGVVMTDPGDIEYRYHVICDGTPTVTCETAEGEPVALETVAA